MGVPQNQSKSWGPWGLKNWSPMPWISFLTKFLTKLWASSINLKHAKADPLPEAKRCKKCAEGTPWLIHLFIL